MTLLQNENSILPFAPGKNVTVIGPLNGPISKTGGHFYQIPDVYESI